MQKNLEKFMEYSKARKMFESLGFEYKYIRGMVDETKHYTRVFEDVIKYKNDKIKLQFNTVSKTLVMVDLKYNDVKFYDNPTIILSPAEIKAIDKQLEELNML